MKFFPSFLVATTVACAMIHGTSAQLDEDLELNQMGACYASESQSCEGTPLVEGDIPMRDCLCQLVDTGGCFVTENGTLAENGGRRNLGFYEKKEYEV